MADVNPLNDMFNELQIGDNTSRSKAKRLKDKENFDGADQLHFCICCLERTESHKELKKHFKAMKHQQSSPMVVEAFQKAKAAWIQEPEPKRPHIVHNYRINLAKVTFLEKYSSNK